MIHAIERGNVCQQRLRGANIAGGLVAANMLLARLNGKAKRWPTSGIAADTNQSSRHFANVLGLCCKVRGVRTAVSHGHAKALHGTNRNIRAQFTGRSKQCERQWIGRHNHQRAARFYFGNHAAPIANAAIG